MKDQYFSCYISKVINAVVTVMFLQVQPVKITVEKKQFLA